VCGAFERLAQRLAAAEAGIDWEWQTQVNADLEARLAQAEARCDEAKRTIEHKYLTNELVPVELLRATEQRLAAAEAEVSAMSVTMSQTNLAMIDLQRQLGTATELLRGAVASGALSIMCDDFLAKAKEVCGE
jgi:hypothetical protein